MICHVTCANPNIAMVVLLLCCSDVVRQWKCRVFHWKRKQPKTKNEERPRDHPLHICLWHYTWHLLIGAVETFSNLIGQFRGNLALILVHDRDTKSIFACGSLRVFFWLDVWRRSWIWLGNSAEIWLLFSCTIATEETVSKVSNCPWK